MGYCGNMRVVLATLICIISGGAAGVGCFSTYVRGEAYENVG